MDLFLDQLFSSIFQVIFLGVAPFVWWLSVSKQKKDNFFRFIGIKKITSDDSHKLVIRSLISLVIFGSLGFLSLKLISNTSILANNKFNNTSVWGILSILLYAFVQPSINFEKLSNLKNIYFAGNHFFNVKKLASLKKVNYEWNSLFNQFVVEEKQTITQGNLTLKVKNIENIDGSLPTIFPQNGGKYDAITGIISWDDLPVNATSVSYVWQGKNSFSGTVTIPIEYPKEEGHGQAQVTYNVNTATPDDPTSNPDYAVLIPNQYELSDRSPLSSGSIAMKNIDDVSQNYAGEQSIKVSIHSAKNYHFDNGGIYKLVDDQKADIPAEITLNKTKPSSVVNAHLEHKGLKQPSSDVLTFTYATVHADS